MNRFRLLLLGLISGTLPFLLSSTQPQDILPAPPLTFGSLGTAPDGTTAGDIFSVGDFNSLGLSDLTVTDTLASAETQPEEVALSEYKLATGSSIEDLAAATGIGQMYLEDVPPIAKVFDETFAFRVIYLDRDGKDFHVRTVDDAIYAFEYYGLEKKLEDVDLSEFAITDVPNLESAKISNFSQHQDSLLKDIPGLISVQIISQLLPLDFFVKMDIPFGQSPCLSGNLEDCAEYNIDNTASGNLKNRSIPCKTKKKAKRPQLCSHIEVWRPSGSTQKIRWISGKDQKVPGGWGVGKAICSEEPTGRFPFANDLIKLVLTDIREGAGEADFALYFAKEIYGPFGKIGETAHCFGPFPLPPPLGTAKENQWTLFGLNDGKIKVDIPIPDGVIGGTSGGGQGSSIDPSQIAEAAEDCEGSENKYIVPTTGQFTSKFGWRWGRMHQGVDIANAIGTPIYASNCGVIDFKDYQGGFGNVVSIEHPGGNVTLYAHLDSPAVVSYGAKVKRGQLIGYMGNTGRSTGPHLHFEFHVGSYGNAEDPEDYVPGLRNSR